jgi:hypothetical protein
MEMKLARLLFTSLLILVASEVALTQDAKKVWKEIIKPCTRNELQGKKVVFLGLSNNVEVGTLLRPRAEQGGYGRASFQNVIDEYQANPASPKPMPNPVVAGGFIGCSGQTTRKKNLNASVSLLSSVLPFTGDFGAALSKATVTTGTVERVAMHDMDELVMARVIQGLTPNSQVRSALLQRRADKKPVWYMVSRAFRVEGLKVRIDFKRNMDLGFKAKYSGPLAGAGVGDLGGGLNATWVNDSVLELTSTAPFFIAAELSYYNEAFRFESRQRPFRSVEMFTPRRVSEDPLQ